MCIPENEQLIVYWNSEKEWNSSGQEEINSFRHWRGGRIFFSPTKIWRKKIRECTGSIFVSFSLKKYKARRDTRELSRVMVMFYILTGVWVTQVCVYMCVCVCEGLTNVHLRFVCTFVCKIYLEDKKTVNKH